MPSVSGEKELKPKTTSFYSTSEQNVGDYFCTDPKKLDRLLNRFIGKEFGIAPDSFRLILV